MSDALHEAFVFNVFTVQPFANDFVIQAFDVEQDVAEHVVVLYGGTTMFTLGITGLDPCSRCVTHDIITSLQNISGI
jgi:hypothetical protein